MKDLKGKKIGLSKSLNTIKNDWWRIKEHRASSDAPAERHDHGRRRDRGVPVSGRLVRRPQDAGADDQSDPNLWLKRDHKHDLAFRPLETALERAWSTRSIPRARPSSISRRQRASSRRSRTCPGIRTGPLQVANIPAVITCTDVMAEEHPELVVTFMKAMIKVGRWANEHKHAAAAILDRQTFYLDVEDTYQGIKHVDMVPNLSPQNLASVEIGKDFMLSHGYIKNDFDVNDVGRAGVPRTGCERAVGRAMEEENHLQASGDR